MKPFNMIPAKRLMRNNSFVKTITTSNQTIKPFESIPGPKGLPLVGNVWRYLPIIGNYKPNDLFYNAMYNFQRYGSIVRERLTASHTILHLFDPDDIEQCFRQSGKFPYRRSHRALLKYRLDRPELYNDGGIFPENGPNWYRQRLQFQHQLMNKTRVLKELPVIDQLSQHHVNKLELDPVSNKSIKLERTKTSKESTILQIKAFDQFIYRWALANSLKLFLDSDLARLSEEEVSNMLRQLDNSLISVEKTEIGSQRWQTEPSKCPFYQMLAKSQEFLYNFVSLRLARVEEEPTNAGSYIHEWLNTYKIDSRDVVSFVIDLLMAGLHTTSYTTAFLLYHISCHPEVQKKVRDELKSHSINEATLTYDQIDRLEFMRDCLKEALRLNPLSIGTGRLTSDENTVIRGYHIPKGTMIITQNQVASINPNYFEQPLDFRPERWTEYRQRPRNQRPSPFTMLPFGFGARACIGQRISELMMISLTARIIQKYEITFEGPIPVQMNLIHNISGPFTVSLKPITP